MEGNTKNHAKAARMGAQCFMMGHGLGQAASGQNAMSVACLYLIEPPDIGNCVRSTTYWGV